MPESARNGATLKKMRDHHVSKVKAIVVFVALIVSHVLIHYSIEKFGNYAEIYSLIADFVISFAVSFTLYSMLKGRDEAFIKLNDQSYQLNLQKEELKKRALELANADKEINSKLEEANKLNKLMVDRELKMVELKKEISKLKGDSK